MKKEYIVPAMKIAERTLNVSILSTSGSGKAGNNTNPSKSRIWDNDNLENEDFWSNNL